MNPIAVGSAIFGLILILHRPAAGLWILFLGAHYAATNMFSNLYGPFNYLVPALVIASWGAHLLFQRQQPVLLPASLALWFLAFIGWILISSCFGRHPEAGLAEAGRYVLLFCLLTAVWNLWSERTMSRALVVYAILMLPTAWISILEFLTRGPANVMLTEAGEPLRLSGLFANANTMGVIMAHSSLVFFALLLRPPNPDRHPIAVRLSTAAAFLLCVGGLVLSFSRSSIIYLVVSCLTLSLFHPIARRVMIAALVVIPGYLLLFSIPTWLHYGLRLEAGQSYRTDLWSAGWRMMLEHPWTGIGPGSGVFESARDIQLDTSVARALSHVPGGGAHNIFFGRGAELGIAGLVLTLTIFALVWKRAWGGLKLYRRGNWTAGLAAAGFFGLSSHAIFETGTTVGRGLIAESFHFFLFALILYKLPTGNPPRGVASCP